MKQPDLFESDWPGRAARAAGRDICANRHQGNAQSMAAFQRVLESMPEQRANVARAIRHAGSHGLTCKELAERWGCGMNAISGRFSELKAKGLVEKVGTREGSGVMRWKGGES